MLGLRFFSRLEAANKWCIKSIGEQSDNVKLLSKRLSFLDALPLSVTTI